ncbi:hypothetical protein V2595_15400 [Tenacibaculum maritimum]|uniref:hypothetical protein n=1 Tax=Tenacibaculum maritimum TaxID=107401 RepID=UPI0013303180|nr:hypothetical protein [Tenacibaculum maritimum]
MSAKSFDLARCLIGSSLLLTPVLAIPKPLLRKMNWIGTLLPVTTLILGWGLSEFRKGKTT